MGELGVHSDSDDDDFCEGLGWLEEVCGEFVIIHKCQCYLMQPAISINGFFHISFSITFTMIDISICLEFWHM